VANRQRVAVMDASQAGQLGAISARRGDERAGGIEHRQDRLRARACCDGAPRMVHSTYL
jgi:hypothetical protein